MRGGSTHVSSSGGLGLLGRKRVANREVDEEVDVFDDLLLDEDVVDVLADRIEDVLVFVLVRRWEFGERAERTRSFIAIFLWPDLI